MPAIARNRIYCHRNEESNSSGINKTVERIVVAISSGKNLPLAPRHYRHYVCVCALQYENVFTLR